MFYPFGVNYGAALEREEWPKDFEMMKKAGLNLILIDGLDPETDYIIKLASENDIKVVFGLGILTMPWKFFEEHPEARFVGMDSKPVPANDEDFRWPQVCYNNPVYRKIVEDTMARVVNRYKNNQMIIAWKIHNEPCYPGTMGCYCENTVKAFRERLKDEYKTVENLNNSWESKIKDWNEVEPPRKLPEVGGSPAAWIDWMNFSNKNIAEFIAWQASIVRKLDPSRPVSTNVYGGFMHPVTGQNEWELAKGLDLLGMDFYPSWLPNPRSWVRRTKMKSVGFLLDAARCAAAPKPAWVFEYQAGPNAESTDFDARDLRIETWSSVAHGMKGMVFYRWEPLVFGAEPWVHFMRDFEGNPSDRVKEAARLSKQIKDILPVISGGETISDVAILLSHHSAALSQGEGIGLSFDDSYRGIYRTLLDNHMPIDFLTPEDIASGKVKGYQALFMPFCYCLDEKTTSGIAEYVKLGGNVVAETYCATRNEKGKPYDVVPGGGLSKVFGCHAVGSKRYRYWFIGHPITSEKETEKYLSLKEGSKFWLCGPRERVEVEKDRIVAANFMEVLRVAYWPHLRTSKSPAVVLGEYGKGKTAYFAASIGEAYMRTDIPYLRQVISGLLGWMGVRRSIIVESPSEQASANVETGLIKKDGELLLIAINHDEAPFTGIFKVLTHKKTAMAVEDVLSKKAVASEIADRYTSFKAKISGRDCRAYHLR